MAILNFPNTGLYVGLTYTGDNGVTYVYDGVKWVGEALVTQGTTGFTGSRGNLGYTGSRGVGYTGSQGDIGYVGSEGSPGLQGNRGYTGSKGDPGDRGLQGNTGEQGVSVTLVGSTSTSAGLPLTGSAGQGWIVNDTGNLWFWSTAQSRWEDIGQIVGPRGDLGYTGSKGSTGDIGLTGDPGYTGSQGTHGYDGSRGNTGYTGSQGDPGYVGSQGDVGYVGSTGDRGPQGYTGSRGLEDRLVNGDFNFILGPDGTLTLPYGQSIGSDTLDGIKLTTDRGTVLFGNTPEQCVPTQSSHFHIMRDDPTTVDLFFGDDLNYVKLPYDSTLTNVGVQIGTDATHLWSFSKDGLLTLPSGNTRIGDLYGGGSDAIIASTGTSFVVLSQGIGGYAGLQWIDDFEDATSVAAVVLNSPLASSSGTVQIATGLVTGPTAQNVWEFDADGNLTIPNDIKDANGSVIRVATTSTAPTRVNGQLWFNSEEGRTYIKYNGQWVDASPTIVPEVSTYLDEITIDGSTLNINDSTLTISNTGTLLVNGQEITGSGEYTPITPSDWLGSPTVGTVTAGLDELASRIVTVESNTGGASGWQITSGSYRVSIDDSGVVTMATSRGNIEFGALPEPGGPSHFHIMKESSSTAVDLYFGDDYNYVLQRGNSNAELAGHTNDYGVEIGTRDLSTGTSQQYVWRFETDGVLTLSTASTILGSGTDPNVYIETATTATTSTWTFGTDGVLTLPAATPVIKGGGTGTDVTVIATTGTNTATWTFAASGGITFPDATVQRTAYPSGQMTVYVNTATNIDPIAIFTLTGTVLLITPEPGYTNTDSQAIILPVQTDTIPLGTKITIMNWYMGTTYITGWDGPAYAMGNYESIDLVYYYDPDYPGNFWWITSSFSW
jgi:hypothetical protein